VEPLGWNFLPAGTTPANPSEALHSIQLAHLLQRLSLAFDWILLDAPPVIPVTGAVLLSARTDGTLLIVRAEQTTKDALKKAIALIGPKRVTAVVLNGAAIVDHGYHLRPVSAK
jgi:Mrp family chromosome partitioning ATPase